MSITVDVYQNNNGSFQAVFPEARPFAANPMTPTPRTDRKPRATLGPLPDELTAGWQWAPWGHDDCLPTYMRQQIEKVPVAGRTISKLIAMMYGNGLCYYRNADLQEGAEVPRAYIKKVEDFLKRNRIKTKFLVAQFADYRYYMNAFSEAILNNRKDQIVGLYHKPAEFSRLSIQNAKTLRVDWLYYAPDFGIGYPPNMDRMKKIPLYDWQNDYIFWDRLSGYKFAYHTRFETPGTMYYARPFWLGLFRKNGWLDASVTVPEVVNAMMKNQVRLKYQILIPESYFIIRHPEWRDYSVAQRNKIIDTLIDDINDTLSGTTNAFQSITTVFKENDMNGKPEGKIEIIAVDDKIKDDAWVPSSITADAQIVQGLGLHPSQIGLANEGGKMGAGSGSDQRESFNTEITLNTIDQEIVLEPLNLVAEFNARTDPDWDITFCIDHTYHTTTNNQESGLQPSSNTIQVD